MSNGTDPSKEGYSKLGMSADSEALEKELECFTRINLNAKRRRDELCTQAEIELAEFERQRQLCWRRIFAELQNLGKVPKTMEYEQWSLWAKDGVEIWGKMRDDKTEADQDDVFDQLPDFLKEFVTGLKSRGIEAKLVDHRVGVKVVDLEKANKKPAKDECH